MFKKIFFLILVILIIGAGWYFYAKQDTQSKLGKIKQQYPELTSYVDDVIKWENKLEENEEDIEMYNTLGLAWKSLAEWSRSAGVANYKDYYKKALEVYEAGVEKTRRRNTLLMTNAGNMAKYIEDYELAENYYKEAISVSPGDVTYYVLLAELYEYEMGKTKEEIVAAYDQGMGKAINSGFIIKRKEAYLERTIK